MPLKKQTPRVSVIILNYNGIDFLKQCIPTVKKQIYSNIEIIVIDNNSTDGSQKYVSRLKNVILIKNPTNYGYAKANNIAAKQSKGEYLFFINNDTELLPDTISQLVECHQPKSIVVPAQIFSVDKKTDKTGVSGTGMDIFGYGYVGSIRTATKPFFPDGAGIFISRRDFFNLGAFDDELFIFHEDIDLGWRAQMFGFQLIQCWSSKYYHYSGGVVPGGGKVKKGYVYKTSLFRIYLNQKNTIRNLIKNYSLPFLLVILPSLLFIHMIEMLILLLLGKWKVVKCYLNAYVWNIMNLNNTLKLRSWIQKHRQVSDIHLVNRMYFAYSKLTALYRLGVPEFI